VNLVPIVRALRAKTRNPRGMGCRSYLHAIKALEVCQHKWAVPAVGRRPMTNESDESEQESREA
jgi:hypothetical protein